MTMLDLAFLLAAGFATGVVGFVTGLASIVSYPALLAAGLAPVSANVTNTVALVAVGIGSTASASQEIAGRGRTLVWWSVAAAVGGIVGAVVLLLSPTGAFEAIVPALVAVASVALLLQPIVRRHLGEADMPRVVPVGVFMIAIYGGYFGAGAGVLFLSLMLLVTSETLWSATVLKSFLLGISNLIAAIGFAAFGPVHWAAAAALGCGALAGGWCGPPIVKVIPPDLLRIGVGIGGLGLAAWLALT